MIVYSSQKTLVDLKLVAIEGGVLLVASAVVLFFAVKIFRREQILTRWK
ncbi:MAG: hypothetical protein WBC63_08615 [Candidatus Bipolaricaulia bacterium]